MQLVDETVVVQARFGNVVVTVTVPSCADSVPAEPTGRDPSEALAGVVMFSAACAGVASKIPNDAAARVPTANRVRIDLPWPSCSPVIANRRGKGK
jgi:hypothetical protein